MHFVFQPINTSSCCDDCSSCCHKTPQQQQATEASLAAVAAAVSLLCIVGILYFFETGWLALSLELLLLVVLCSADMPSP
jgi:hypothetical protein